MKSTNILLGLLMCCSAVSAQESYQIHTKVGTFTYPLSDANKHKVSFIASKSQAEPADLGLSVKWARTNMEAYSDSAVAALGEGWRMPTLEEWKELRQATFYDSHDASGVYVASNDDYIFVPGISSYEIMYDEYLKNRVVETIWGNYNYNCTIYPRAVYDTRGFDALQPTDITATVSTAGVTLACKANHITALDSVGFVIGTSGNVEMSDAVASAALPDGSDYTFSFNNFEHLQLSTTYYYRPYAVIGGRYDEIGRMIVPGRMVYGEAATFRTVDVADAQTTANCHEDTKGWSMKITADMSQSGAVIPTRKAWEEFCGQHSSLFAGQTMYSYYKIELDKTYSVEYMFTDDDLAAYKHASRMLTTKWAQYIKDARYADDVKTAAANARTQHCSDFDLLLAESIPASFYTYLTTESLWIPASDLYYEQMFGEYWSEEDEGYVTGYVGKNVGGIEERTIKNDQGEDVPYIVVSPRSSSSHPLVYFDSPEELMSCKYKIEVVMAPSIEEGKPNQFSVYMNTTETNYREKQLDNPDQTATFFDDDTKLLKNKFESSASEIKTILVADDYYFRTVQYGTTMSIKSNFTSGYKNTRSRYLSIVGIRFTPVVE